jgi:hypothetical protein
MKKNNLVAVLHVALLSGCCDTPQFPLSCELLVQHLELVDQLLTNRSKNIPRSDSPVRLNSDKKLRNVGVGNLVSSHVDVGVHLEVLGKKVSESVVFLHENKVRSVGHSREDLLLDLLLALSEEEELETIRGVHLRFLIRTLDNSIFGGKVAIVVKVQNRG